MQATRLAIGPPTPGAERGSYLTATQVLSPGRSAAISDEPVRHKDCWMPWAIWARQVRRLLGHIPVFARAISLTNTLLRRAVRRPPARCVLVECDAQMASRLPGFGLSG